MKAAFLDRDGVIINNSSHYYIYQTKDIEFVEGIFENLQRLSQSGFQLFVVSNQGGIAKKIYSKSDVEKVHAFIDKALKKHHLKITEWAYCPHHESVENCLCRKPAPLMIEKLIAKHQINGNESILIGDSKRDIEAGEKAGIKSILIPSNQNMFPFIKKYL